MKIIDLRPTQSHGFVADVLLNERSLQPISIKVENVELSALVDYCNSDMEHIQYADPRTVEEKERDTLTLEWNETYKSLIGG